LGYLKIKEAADTLGMICFCCNVKPFGWYVSAKNGIVKVPPLFSMVFERFSRIGYYRQPPARSTRKTNEYEYIKQSLTEGKGHNQAFAKGSFLSVLSLASLLSLSCSFQLCVVLP